MEEEARQIKEQERQERNEMLFTLSERDRGTLAMIVTPNERKQQELYLFLKDHLKEYAFFDLDLTTYTYTSLYKALQERLPPSIVSSEPVQYLVSVSGLESSLYNTKASSIEFSSLIPQLNFERELIFSQPYIILLWVSEEFDRALQKKAPDLMQWMSKRFVFKDDNLDSMIVAEEAVEYEIVRKRGKIQKRIERIHQLKETWEKLCSYQEDRPRMVRDKINLLRLLGSEYARASEFQRAEEAFKKALFLNEKVNAVPAAELFNEVGVFYYEFGKYETALDYLLKALEIFKEHDNRGLSYTYQVIGMVYKELHRLNLALENYRLSLEWYIKTDRESGLGIVYQLMGMVFEEQRKWIEALENYRLSLEWKEKTGDHAEIGMTYYQIGSVYEAMGKYEIARDFFQKAVSNLTRYDHPNTSLARESFARIQKRLTPPNPLDDLR